MENIKYSILERELEYYGKGSLASKHKVTLGTVEIF